MSNSKSTTKKLTILALLLFVLFSYWMLDRDNFNHMLNASWRILDEDSYFKQYTSPLSSNIIGDLCEKFELPDSDWRCHKQNVYAMDFYPAIIEYYSGTPSKERTSTIVQEKIGEYQVTVEIKIKNDVKNYWYWYDFTGDQRYPFIIVFDENGIMIDIRSRSGRDS